MESSSVEEGSNVTIQFSYHEIIPSHGRPSSKPTLPHFTEESRLQWRRLENDIGTKTSTVGKTSGK